jgi:hypothetical protein
MYHKSNQKTICDCCLYWHLLPQTLIVSALRESKQPEANIFQQSQCDYSFGSMACFAEHKKCGRNKSVNFYK